MASMSDTVQNDLECFNHLYKYAYPNSTQEQYLFRAYEVVNGTISIETVFENALANCGSYSKYATVGQDFTDGSDAKKTTARESGNRKFPGGYTITGTRYSAPVTGIHAKIGTLRVLVHERVHQEFYYFAFPHSYYGHKISRKTQNLEIPFYNMHATNYGMPMRTSELWKFELPTFEDMATAKFD